MTVLPRARKDAGALGPKGGEIAAVGNCDDLSDPVEASWHLGPKAIVHRTMEIILLSLRLPTTIEKRLNALANKTGRSKSFYAREAILRHIEDIEDEHLARLRTARRRKRVALEELERKIFG